MARPKTPLISRRKTLEVALEIVDDEGLEALSIRRLGEALNVNGASFYHHFKNKEEILAGVAQLALAEVLPPESTDEVWQEWILRNAQRLRAALLEHPNLVPVILQRGPLGIGSEQMEESARVLSQQGVPIGYIHVLVRGLEIIALGSVLEETQGGETELIPDLQRDKYPMLYESSVSRSLDSTELFDALARATIRMVEESIEVERRDRVKASGRKQAGVVPGSKQRLPGRRTAGSAVGDPGSERVATRATSTSRSSTAKRVGPR